MRQYRKKQIAYVKNLLKTPIWYNQAITSKNWPAIKKQWKVSDGIMRTGYLKLKKQEDLTFDKQYRSYFTKAITLRKTSVMIAGVTAE